MNNKKDEIKSILDLQSNDSIGAELASRQLEIITRAYLYLSSPKNNIIYIADEVGLGKTYIAAGIAMLLRHFSTNVNNHKEVIIVPKKNLQGKWRRELNNFIRNNYLPTNDIIKTQFDAENSIKDRLAPIKEADPITIFRMTSFSALASPRNSKTELKNYLIHEIFKQDPFAIDIIGEAWGNEKGYFNQSKESDLRKLISYLLNAISPKIDCLIIDEAHNYKHGLGVEDHDGSIRNEVTARFLGAFNDSKILNDFPSLKSKVKFPLAEKIICLSATPKDRSLFELKNQFDCFSNHHLLNNAKSKEDVKSKLKNFLIRGNLEYTIEGKSVSRNQCRFEHRLGNINKDEIAVPLTLEDGFEGVFWQLLQYKSIKHLNIKNNPSFEIGMLAGFECYQLDVERKKVVVSIGENENLGNANKEYDLVAKRKIKESQDYNVVKRLVTSFKDTFSNELPPHPKQTKLENEIISQINRQEKSLIFVRRVATAYELEKRLLGRYEKDIVIEKLLKLDGNYSVYNTGPVKEIVKEFNNKYILEKLDELFHALLGKPEVKNYVAGKIIHLDVEIGDKLNIWFRTAFLDDSEYKRALEAFILNKRKNISSEIKVISIRALEATYDRFLVRLKEMEEDDPDDSQDEVDNGYFFANYFKKGKTGFRYRNKIYRENWFDLNILLLNDKFCFLSYDARRLKIESEKINFGSVKKKHQLFQKQQEFVQNFLSMNGLVEDSAIATHSAIPAEFDEQTFLTSLLREYCIEEMTVWVSKKIKKQSTENIIKDLSLLNIILKGVFRKGSGLLAGFVAESSELDFSKAMFDLLVNLDSPFHFVLKEIKTIIRDFDLLIAINFQERDETKINNVWKSLSPIVGTTGQDERDRGVLASQFRMPGFPYVLITTDIFREGEDLHSYCQNIYHYGIGWNPSDMEQRTGRIDRINSLSYRKINETNLLAFDNKIQVFYPYLSQSVEVNQVVELLKNINKFLETFNEIEVDIKYDSFVQVDSDITESDIPTQITKKLRSLYDVWEFEVN
ncbi:MAG: DEAD/DEAH box helicase family protein [Bacteroidetes bacterium]|nr:DEAD/DEAH box helicase family protein [Bacteroidota bacterium]